MVTPPCCPAGCPTGKLSRPLPQCGNYGCSSPIWRLPHPLGSIPGEKMAFTYGVGMLGPASEPLQGQCCQDTTGAVPDGQAWLTPACGHLMPPFWPWLGAVGQVETQANARPHCRLWLARAHSVLMATLGLHKMWEFHINSMRSCHDMSHDSKLSQHFTDFGQGGWVTFT